MLSYFGGNFTNYFAGGVKRPEAKGSKISYEISTISVEGKIRKTRQNLKGKLKNCQKISFQTRKICSKHKKHITIMT